MLPLIIRHLSIKAIQFNCGKGDKRFGERVSINEGGLEMLKYGVPWCINIKVNKFAELKFFFSTSNPQRSFFT